MIPVISMWRRDSCLSILWWTEISILSNGGGAIAVSPPLVPRVKNLAQDNRNKCFFCLQQVCLHTISQQNPFCSRWLCRLNLKDHTHVLLTYWVFVEISHRWNWAHNMRGSKELLYCILSATWMYIHKDEIQTAHGISRSLWASQDVSKLVALLSHIWCT
jgi:hypothetical protein